MRTVRARAPGKLILTGEHSILHGLPALAFAIDLYTTTTISQQTRSKPFTAAFQLLNFADKSEHPLNKLKRIAKQLKVKHDAFKAGKLGVKDILKKPIQLAEYVASQFIEHYKISPTAGLKINTKSEIPVGCGMGSSAAAIVSGNAALSAYFNQTTDLAEHLLLCTEAENLQHGYTSGLDINISTHGGCLASEAGVITKMPLPDFDFTLINTGTPTSTTGECVSHTQQHYKKALFDEQFIAVFSMMKQALIDKKEALMQRAIKENHQLLNTLGIVPRNIAAFIQAIEASGGAAKVSGAGSVCGEHAGAVLALGDNEKINAIAAQFSFQTQRVSCSAKGAHIL